jgi:glycosyltransferase involved in cell wall biosynthesis
LLYDLDDDLFHQPEWVGHAAGLARELDLVELLVRSSDLVTVSTPVLSAALAAYTSRMIVVRNAIEPGLYERDSAGAPAPGGEVRALFYGAEARTRDYELCRSAVDEACRRRPRIRRVWLGATGPKVRALVDETHPYAPAGAAFASALAAARPDIGLAPLGSGDFERAKSELHWLEYSAAGAATIACRLRPNGPYDVIRDGVDGLMAESADDWRRHLASLAGSAALRTEMAGRARERVIAEYSAASRAVQWAAVFRWVASHPGVGLG